MSESSGRSSIAQFLAEERERLTGYVYRLIQDAGDRDAEDIVHDVALSLLDRADVLMPIEALSAYIYRSLRNRVIDYVRGRKKMVSLDEEMGDEEGTTSPVFQLSDAFVDVEREVTRSELRRRLFEAIEALPDEQKAVVVETEVSGKGFRQLSEEWEIPMGTLLARKSRAMAKIRESLRDLKP